MKNKNFWMSLLPANIALIAFLHLLGESIDSVISRCVLFNAAAIVGYYFI